MDRGHLSWPTKLWNGWSFCQTSKNPKQYNLCNCCRQHFLALLRPQRAVRILCQKVTYWIMSVLQEPNATELLARMPGSHICLVLVAMYITDKTGELCSAQCVVVVEGDTVLPQRNKALLLPALTYQRMPTGTLEKWLSCVPGGKFWVAEILPISIDCPLKNPFRIYLDSQCVDRSCLLQSFKHFFEIQLWSLRRQELAKPTFEF